ncbi:MAG: 3-methylcrotonoyl-CoA carboxylase, alpha subunit, partial [Ramlibacter sp.]|nr:3-methylcrotonoyl-CoA carboxylase, alpha subunit [Ramlibacter sp.]
FERADQSAMLPRIDDGVREGDAISPFYDSMIAKLIVHGDTREQALAALDQALAQTHIVGLATNVQFLRHVVRSPSFAKADLDTALITREQAVLFKQEPLGLSLAVAAAVAHALLQEQAQQGADPFSRRDGWRSHGVAVRPFAFEFHGEAARAELTYLRDGALTLTVGNVSGALTFARNASGIDIHFAGQRLSASVYTQGESAHVFSEIGATQILAIDLLAHAGEGEVDGGRLTAPMPGKVVSFAVKVGDTVSKGQALAVMEAMKMEHTVAAPADGLVAELLYAPGDQVAEGAQLLRIAPR